MSTTQTMTVEAEPSVDDIAFETDCPDWCRLSGRSNHRLAHETTTDGRHRRTHAGPNFGEHLEAFADEYTDEPGVLHFGVNHMVDEADGAVDHTTSDELDKLVRDAAAAERWLTDRVCEAEQANAEPTEPAWWETIANPPCAPWCEVEHLADELATDSGFFCIKVIEETEHYRVAIERYQGAGPEAGDIEVTDEVFITTDLTGDKRTIVPTAEIVRDFANALREAAYILDEHQRRERAEAAAAAAAARLDTPPEDLPWWMSEPNPPCSPWCTERHDSDEFKAAGSGSLFCRRTIHDSDTLLVVLQQIHSEDGNGGIETDEPCLRIHAPGLDDVDDITLPAAAAIVSGLVDQLGAATQEATRLVDEVTAR